MTAEDFRSFMIAEVRAFDRWAWKDARDNPSDYSDYTQEDWYKLFLEYMENRVV